jgi:voltage-gated potassium channel
MLRNKNPHSLTTFIISIVLVFVVLLIGTVGFYFIELSTVSGKEKPNNLLDAFYFAITSLTTTGYGDIVPHNYVSRAFVTLFLIGGIVTATWAGANVVAFVVEGHLSEAVRERKMNKTIKSLKGHFIICGLGRVGREVVGQFRSSSLDYVVIDKSRECIESTLNDPELYVIGDTTQDDVLKDANIEQAKGLIACCPSDAVNVFTILTAKGLNQDLFVISRGQDEKSRTKLLQAGANRIVMPSHLGGMRLAAMAMRPAIVDFLDQTFVVSEEDGPLLLEEIPVRKGNELIDKMLQETDIKSQTGVTIMGVKDETGKMILNPSSTFVIRENQILIGMGREKDFKKLRKKLGVKEEPIHAI